MGFYKHSFIQPCICRTSVLLLLFILTFVILIFTAISRRAAPRHRRNLLRQAAARQAAPALLRRVPYLVSTTERPMVSRITATRQESISNQGRSFDRPHQASIYYTNYTISEDGPPSAASLLTLHSHP